MALALHLHMVI
jgi:hypothetical protein